ncbi:hypothetical protein [Salinigranum marinum]|uniref:hypothetical protein n=1 Tax=Salinigranum marinum TaxID=1515595 RepID=UPI002989F0CA|nr:hypothetical protein [Salinigranum marinum]
MSEDVSPVGVNATGGVLQPESKGNFKYRISFRNKSKNQAGPFINPEERNDGSLPPVIVFDLLLDRLVEEGISVMFFQHKLIYNDVYGNEYTEAFPTRRLIIDQTTSISDLIDAPIWVEGESEEMTVVPIGDMT